MNALTKTELELRRAQLAHEAEKLRQKREHLPITSPYALAVSKRAKALQERVEDYTRLLAAAEAETKEARKAA